MQAGGAEVVVEAATEEPLEEESDLDLKALAVLVSGLAEDVAELRRRRRAVLLLHSEWRGLLMNVPMRVWERAQMKKQESNLQVLEPEQKRATRAVVRVWRKLGMQVQGSRISVPVAS